MQAQRLLGEGNSVANTLAAEVLWELWADPLNPSPPMGPLPAFLAGALGHCARVLCPSNFSVSECISPSTDVATKRGDPETASAFANVGEAATATATATVNVSRACSGAVVVAAPAGFMLQRNKPRRPQRQQLGGESRDVDAWDPMVFVDGGGSDGGGSNSDDPSPFGGDGGRCWVYPGEHMSFAILTAQQQTPIQRRPNPNINDNSNKKKKNKPSTSELSFDRPVGSLLHIAGLENFFHAVREGLGSLLCLSTQLDSLSADAPLLVPDTPLLRRVVSLVLKAHHQPHSELTTTKTSAAVSASRVVFVGPKVTSVTAPSFLFPDWRPPGGGSMVLAASSSGGKTSSGNEIMARLFDVGFMGSVSANAFVAARGAMEAARTDEEALKLPAKVCAEGQGEEVGGGEEEEEAIEVELTKDSEKKEQKEQKEHKLVLYVSRSDANLRRVVRFEAELVQSLQASFDELARTTREGDEDGDEDDEEYEDEEEDEEEESEEGGDHEDGDDDDAKGDGAKGREEVAEEEEEEEEEEESEGGGDAYEVRMVVVEKLTIEEVSALFASAAVVVGPHGAGLFNAPLFSHPGTAVVSFGLVAEHKEKEGNLAAACSAVGQRFVSLSTLVATFTGDYLLSPPSPPSSAPAVPNSATGLSSYFDPLAGQQHQPLGDGAGPQQPPPTPDQVAQSVVSHLLFGF